MYMSGAYDVLLSNRLQTLALWFLRIVVYCYDFSKNLFFRLIQDFLDDYVWINVGLMVYMSGEAPFMVWVDSSAQLLAEVCKCTSELVFAQECKHLRRCVSVQLLAQMRKYLLKYTSTQVWKCLRKYLCKCSSICAPIISLCHTTLWLLGVDMWTPGKHETLNQCWLDVGPTSNQHCVNVPCLLSILLYHTDAIAASILLVLIECSVLGIDHN